MGQIKLQELFVGNSVFKVITENDIKTIYNWRNQDYVRNMMKDSSPIPYKNHQQWFNKIIKNNPLLYFIYYINNRPVGVMNFKIDEKDTKSVEWGFYLGETNLPARTGTKLCSDGIILAKSLDYETITSFVLHKNIKSVKIHENLGFIKYNTDDSCVFYSKDLTK